MSQLRRSQSTEASAVTQEHVLVFAVHTLRDLGCDMLWVVGLHSHVRLECRGLHMPAITITVAY